MTTDRKLDEYLAKTDLDNFETDNIGVQSKKVSLYAFDTDELTKKRLTGKTIGTDFAISVSDISGLNLPDYDYIGATYPTASQEVYTYKTGGVSGTTVGTITINYTDSTKNVLSSVVKS